MNADVVDAEHRQLAVTEPVKGQLAAWVPTFAESVDAMVAKVEAKHDFFRRVMRKGVHYGTLPGVKPKEGESEKYVLFKPGAELLLTNMGLNPVCEDASVPIERPTVGDDEGEFAYRRRCKIYRQTGPSEADRMLVAQAEGSCTSREVKYRWRESRRLCPSCGLPHIIQGKAEYGGGWLCFKKQGGCGVKYAYDDPKIASQTVGRTPNPDLDDCKNTILKMADKRAIVAATLIATGCSDIFTQDLDEDNDPGSVTPSAGPAPKADVSADESAQRKGIQSVLDLCHKMGSTPPSREFLESRTVLQLRGIYRQVQSGVSVPQDAPEPAPEALLAPGPQPTPAPAETDAEAGFEAPPEHCAAPAERHTVARLFATLASLGIKEKPERISWAQSFGPPLSELRSYTGLCEHQAQYLAEMAASELTASRKAPADGIYRGAGQCPACNAFTDNPHAKACPESGIAAE